MFEIIIVKETKKYLLREAFKNYYRKCIIQKKAFSDGVSKETRSWHKIIQKT